MAVTITAQNLAGNPTSSAEKPRKKQNQEVLNEELVKTSVIRRDDDH